MAMLVFIGLIHMLLIDRYAIAKYENVIVTSKDNYSLNGFSVTDQVKGNGYPVEVHSNIETEDGYLITLHRIPRGVQSTGNGTRPVVLLVHGLGSSADCWVAMGPERGLAFLLADRGYDVWMANARGTLASRKHATLDPDENSEYWDFSWHEIGYYDHPANIHYIIDRTGQKNLTYVGHSQGGTTFYVMATTRPEMNRHIKLFVGLAPGVFYGFENVALPQSQASFIFQQIESATPTLKKLMPNSLSARQALHFMQLFLVADFRQYDFGPDRNLRKYKRRVPPSYDLKKATVPAALFSAFADNLVLSFNIDRLARSLPNTVLQYRVPWFLFNHFDYIIARDVVELVYEKVFQIMDEYRE